MTDFDAALDTARTPNDAWIALMALAGDRVGMKLFTIMTVDMDALLARRAFSSDPANYPAAGTKPIAPNAWFNHVHGHRLTFVANNLDEINAVFPDAELIESLGCGAVINLPIVDDGALVATMNILHEPGYYTTARVALAEHDLTGPAHRAYSRARSLGPLL